MEIKVYATLRDIVGASSIHLSGVSEITVQQLLDDLCTRYPDMRAKLIIREGEWHPAMHLLINGRDARYNKGMETIITAKDEVRIFPPVGGGVR